MRALALLLGLSLLISLACGLPVIDPGAALPTAAPALPTLTPAGPGPAPEATPTDEPKTVDPTPTAAAVGALDYTLTENSLQEELLEPVPYTLTLLLPQLEPASVPAHQAFNALVQTQANDEVAVFNQGLVDVPPLEGGFGPTSFDISYTPFEMTERLVSVRLSYSGYVSGAAHPFWYDRSINYDLIANRDLALTDLFLAGADPLSRIAAYCVTQLEQTDFFAGFEAGAQPTPENYRTWNLTPEGLLITFDTYQVGPYAAGPQEITVPWKTVADILDPAWARP
jgi:hypothetical protein